MLCYSVVIEFESQQKTKLNAVIDQRCYGVCINFCFELYANVEVCKGGESVPLYVSELRAGGLNRDY